MRGVVPYPLRLPRSLHRGDGQLADAVLAATGLSAVESTRASASGSRSTVG